MATYSLAETFYQLSRFKDATNEYQRILNPDFESILTSKKLPRSTLYVRLVSSRYQELKTLNLIPEKVKPHALKDNLLDVSSANAKLMKEWNEWIMALLDLKCLAEELPSVASFNFETLKLTYVYFDTEKAIKELETFGLKHHSMEEGPMALTLALDSYSLNQNWTSITSLSAQIEKLKQNKTDFIESVRSLDATAKLKLTLAEKDPEKALSLSEDCLDSHGSKAIKLECSMTHARSLVGLKKLEKAEKELSQILSGKDLDVEHTKASLLMRAQVRHDLAQTDSFIEDLEHYLSLTHYEDQDMSRQVVENYWYKGHAKLHSLLENKEVCRAKLEALCEQYRTIAIIDENRESDVQFATAFKNSSKAESNLRAMWALMALKNAQKRAFQDRLVLLQRIASSYDNLKPGIPSSSLSTRRKTSF